MSASSGSIMVGNDERDGVTIDRDDKPRSCKPASFAQGLAAPKVIKSETESLAAAQLNIFFSEDGDFVTLWSEDRAFGGIRAPSTSFASDSKLMAAAARCRPAEDREIDGQDAPRN